MSYKIQSKKIKGKEAFRVLDAKNNVVNKQPFDDRIKAENFIKYLEEQDSLKLIPKPSKPSENIKRLGRLTEPQAEGYAGSLLAQQDSARVEADLPQFKTAATKKKEAKKYKEKVLAAELKLAEIQTRIDKAKITIDTYENQAGTLASDEEIKLKQAKRTIKLEELKKKNIMDKYPEMNQNPLQLNIPGR